MKKILGLLFVALFALVVVGCGPKDEGDDTPTYPKCKTTAHCASKGEVCVSGTCVECGTDGDCAKAGTCMGCAGNKCVKKENCCSSDRDCSNGDVCRAKPGSKTGTCGK